MLLNRFNTLISVCLALILSIATLESKAEEVLRVGWPEQSQEPFVLIEGISEKTYSGIYFDLLTEITNETGIKFVFKEVPPLRRRFFFDRGEIDIEIGVHPKWRSKSIVKNALYTDPFMIQRENVYFSKQHQVDASGYLLGQKIGMVRGYSYPEVQPYLDKNVLYRSDFTNESLLAWALAVERVQQAVLKESTAGWINIKAANYPKFIAGKRLDEIKVSIRLHPQHEAAFERLNNAIAQIIKDGRMTSIHKTYTGFDLTP